MKKTLAYIAAHPLVIALIAGAVSVLVLPVLITKYKGSIAEHRKYSKKTGIFYQDIFGNGKREQVVSTSYSPLNQGLVKIHEPENNSFYGIWNLNEKSLQDTPLLFGDYDNNQIKEIWAFTSHKDSIFYYLINPEKDGEYIRKRQFIATTSFVKEQKVDVRVRSVGEQDINGDGYREMYFAIDAGFSMTPRRLYAVDIHNDKIYKSPKFGLRFKNLYMEDLDGDGYREIIGETSASDNYPDTCTYPYNDNSSWLLVFNKNLDFFFNPFEFKGAPSYTAVNVVASGKKKNLLVHFHDRSKKGGDAFICLFNLKGEKVNQVRLDTLVKDYKDISLFNYNREEWDKNYMLDRDGIIYILNNDLEITNQISLPIDCTGNPHYLDINKAIPGQEIIFPSSSGFLITDNAFNVLTKIDSDDDCTGSYNIGIINTKNNKTRISLSYNNQYYEISFFQNPAYNYRWLIPAGIFLLSFLISYQRKKYFKNKRNQKIQKKLRLQETEKKRLAKELHDELGSKLTGLRLKIENARETENLESLNEITSYIHKTHTEIRNIINNLTPPKFREYDYISIIENLIEEYNKHGELNIQLEFYPPANWNGKIPEDIKFHSYRILQEAITNIIKHSNASKSNIQIHKHKNSLYIYVEDDGKGFDKEEKTNLNQGLGLENIKLRAELLNGNLNIKSDKKGTILEIELPIK